MYIHTYIHIYAYKYTQTSLLLIRGWLSRKQIRTYAHFNATHCNTLKCTVAQQRDFFTGLSPHTATHCHTLPHTAIHCNLLPHTAAYCNTLTPGSQTSCPAVDGETEKNSGSGREEKSTATHCHTEKRRAPLQSLRSSFVRVGEGGA